MQFFPLTAHENLFFGLRQIKEAVSRWFRAGTAEKGGLKALLFFVAMN